ncbi:MAG: methionine ABC transporter permease [Oscillospiraceae bacterium]|nr:methionine ABC transporter permease [Oscillospiraceae bacterium]
MTALLEKIIPNVMEKLPILWESIGQTLVMVFVSGAIALVFGLVLGVVLTVTKPGGILEHKVLYTVLDKIINLFRSIPFIILIPMIMPLSRIIVGTGIGTKGVIIPLIVGTIPFFSRQTESALAELDGGVVEAAQAMGNSPWEIIWHVYLRESIPGLMRAVTITFVSLVGLTAMAGAIGGGGLGDYAIRYGHQRHQTDVIYVCVILILILITAIQSVGELIIKKTKH